MKIYITYGASAFTRNSEGSLSFIYGIKQVASQANDKAGDGTTTATILARAIFKEGCKSVAAGMNPMDLRRGI